MRLFVYAPESEDVDQALFHIDGDFSDEEYEIEYTRDIDDLLILVKNYDYDAIVVFQDEGTKRSYAVLDALARRELTGPVVCAYQNAHGQSLYNILHRGVTSTIPYSPETYVSGTFRLLVENAYVAFKGRSRVMEFGAIKVDFDSRLVFVNDQPIDLTKRQFRLFEFLIDHAGQVRSKEQIYAALYVQDDDVELKIIDVFICKLRDELDNAMPGLGKVIETSWGNGYRFIPNPEEEKTYTKKFATFELDFTNMEARVDGNILDLTINEFMVLKSFVAQYPDPVTMEKLVTEVGKFGASANEDKVQRTIQSLLKKLRQYGEGYEHFLVRKQDGSYILNLADIDARAARRVKQDITTIGALKINHTTKQVYFKNQRARLTGREYDILNALAAEFPKIMSGDELAESVYGDQGKESTLTQSMIKLRAKLKALNADRDVIVNRRGEGFRIDLESKQIEKKFGDRYEGYSMAPWRVDLTRRTIYFQSDDENAREIELSLTKAQYNMLSKLIMSYPSAISFDDMLQGMYGEEHQGKEASLKVAFSQLKATLASQLGVDSDLYLRKIEFLNHKLLRLDLNIDQISADIEASCDRLEVGAWEVNRTTQMVLFDGDPIAVTDREYFLMKELAEAYPKACQKTALAKKFFDNSETVLATCLSGLRKKLREGYAVTQDVTTYKRGIGYRLNADVQELRKEQITAFDQVELGDGATLNRDLAQISISGKTIDIGAAALFAIEELMRADTPLTAEQLSYASLDGLTIFEEATIRFALITQIKTDFQEHGLEDMSIVDDNRVAGFFLKSNRDRIVENCEKQELGPITLNHTLRELIYDHTTIALNRSEYGFICALMSQPTQPMSKEAVSDFSLQEEGAEVVTETSLNTACGQIVKKLEDAGATNPDIVKNKRGMGYFFTHMEGYIDFGSGTRFIKVGSLEMDTQTSVATYGNVSLSHVTDNTFVLMALLARRDGEVVPYIDIAARFFGAEKADSNIKNAQRGVRGLKSAIAKTSSELADQLIQISDDGCQLSVRADQFAGAANGGRSAQISAGAQLVASSPSPVQRRHI